MPDIAYFRVTWGLNSTSLPHDDRAFNLDILPLLTPKLTPNRVRLQTRARTVTVSAKF